MLIQGTFTQEAMQIDSYHFVVKDVNSIHFTLVKGAFEHFFVIVKDSHKQIRALLTYKSRQRQYCLTKCYETSSNYTLAGALPNGEWSVEVVRTYPIQGDYELQIAFDLGGTRTIGKNPLALDFMRIYDERIGWYKGDFHMHSAYSDGRVCLDEVAQACKQKHLDVMSMSEHSAITTKFPLCDAMVLPSTEITWDDDGHYNIHGLTDLVDYASFIKQAPDKSAALNALFQHYHAQGCVLSINHPFPIGWELRHDFDIRSFQLLEVVNAPHLLLEEIDNEKALRFFDYLWQKGYQLYAVGGSDAHKKNYYESYPIAIPETKVYCEGLSADHVLQALAQGHSFIQVEDEFELLFHRPQNEKMLILPGERVQGEVMLRGRCKTSMYWELICNGKCVFTSYGKRFVKQIHVEANTYYRLQARTAEKTLALLVNPIHNMSIQPKEYHFQKIVSAFLAEDTNNI